MPKPKDDAATSPTKTPDTVRRTRRMRRRAAVLIALTIGVLFTIFASNVAVVAVQEGPQRLDPRGLSGCQLPLVSKLRDPATCVEATMQRMVEQDGIAGLKGIASHYKYGGAWYRDRCHVLMHPVGRANASSIAINELLALPPNDCLGGFLHGVIEVRARDFDNNDADSMRELCTSTTPSQEMDCLHGIGHALMRALDNDLPTAIARCTVADDRELTINCAGGVMMENMFAVRGEDETKTTRWFDPNDPGSTCRTMDDVVAQVCHAWDVALLKPERRLAYCRAVDGTNNETCLRSVGASENRLGIELCKDEEECWFGFGYSQQLTMRARDLADDPCAGVPSDGEKGCLRGAAFASWATTSSTRPLGSSWCEQRSDRSDIVAACVKQLQDPEAAVGFL